MHYTSTSDVHGGKRITNKKLTHVHDMVLQFGGKGFIRNCKREYKDRGPEESKRVLRCGV